jgi:hypothetical protein
MGIFAVAQELVTVGIRNDGRKEQNEIEHAKQN